MPAQHTIECLFCSCKLSTIHQGKLDKAWVGQLQTAPAIALLPKMNLKWETPKFTQNDLAGGALFRLLSFLKSCLCKTSTFLFSF